MTYINYNLGEIIENINSGNQTHEMIELYNQIMQYKSTLNRRVDACIQTINFIKPDNTNKWIYENVSDDIRYYVYQKIAGEEINVLTKGKGKWKTLADIGLAIKHQF